MKNPFKSGDVLWFTIQGAPVAVYNVLDKGMLREVGEIGLNTLEAVLKYFKGKAEGPYRVIQTENWSEYDFNEE